MQMGHAFAFRAFGVPIVKTKFTFFGAYVEPCPRNMCFLSARKLGLVCYAGAMFLNFAVHTSPFLVWV